MNVNKYNVVLFGDCQLNVKYKFLRGNIFTRTNLLLCGNPCNYRNPWRMG